MQHRVCLLFLSIVLYNNANAARAVISHDVICDLLLNRRTATLLASTFFLPVLREVFACGLRTPGRWNPEISSRNPESRYQLEFGIQVALTKNP